jgi:hypothetical protein
MSSIRQVYSSGRQSLLSRLPKSIKVLKINTAFFGSSAKSLHQSRIQPTELVYYCYSYPDEILDRPYDSFEDSYNGEVLHIYGGLLSHGPERQYIQGLDSLKSLTCKIDSDSVPFDGKVFSRSIDMLKILYYDRESLPSLKLEKLFIVFPSVEDLTILKGSYGISASTDTPQVVYPNLKRLSLGFLVKQETVNFIRNCLPNLKVLELKFNGDIRDDKKRFKIDLTGLDLTIFSLRLKGFMTTDMRVYVEIKSRESSITFCLYNESKSYIPTF